MKIQIMSIWWTGFLAREDAMYKQHEIILADYVKLLDHLTVLNLALFGSGAFVFSC